MTKAVRRWAAGAVAMLALTGCAPAAQAPVSSGDTGTKPAAEARRPAADCTRATKVTLGDHFKPSAITVARGGFIAAVNKTDAVRDLEASPDAGLVTSVLDKRERQVIQFPRAGTFTVRSGSAALKVTVAGESGCGLPKPVLTITDSGVFSPAHLTVQPTINFTVANKSAAAHALTCDPDTGGNRDNTRLDSGETEILAIDRPGRYTCHSVQHPSAKVVITVAGR